MSKKKKRKGFSSCSWRDVYGYVIWFCIICYLVVECSRQTYHNHLLVKRGKQVVAYVTASYSQGNHRVADYVFIVNGHYYDGQLRFEHAEKGDSIIVLYLPEDPHINKAQFDLE